MNVVIAGNFLFPTGSATAARIRNLAVGLAACGVHAHILAMAPTYTTTAIRTPQTFAEKVTYECLAGWQSGSKQIQMRNSLKDKPAWFFQAYSSVLYAYQKLARLIHQKQCDLFIGYGRNALQLAPLAALCRQHGVTTLLDVVEQRAQFAGFGGRLNPIYWDWYLGEKWMPRLFDGATVIASALIPILERAGCQQNLIVPSLEAWDTYKPAPAPSMAKVFELLYIGALLPRDAPEMLFDIMRILSQRQVPTTLKVVGKFREVPEGRRWIDVCAGDPALNRSVQLLERVSDEELRHLMASADGLILPRRNAPTEIASFPTRLVEYLQEGVPVFVSNVGDINHYLRHGQDAFLLDPVDPQQGADVIEAVVKSADRGRAIGLQGRCRGAECFDRKKHAHRILAFAQELHKV